MDASVATRSIAVSMDATFDVLPDRHGPRFFHRLYKDMAERFDRQLQGLVMPPCVTLIFGLNRPDEAPL